MTHERKTDKKGNDNDRDSGQIGHTWVDPDSAKCEDAVEDMEIVDDVFSLEVWSAWRYEGRRWEGRKRRTVSMNKQLVLICFLCAVYFLEVAYESRTSNERKVGAWREVRGKDIWNGDGSKQGFAG
ncbi:hypothetical protein BKA82DRAFT_4012191 [Pisolithus tinctorius]|nr:hypothetical protein BKA82DRAFT_4012191 [Pisolithus tinctorius]